MAAVRDRLLAVALTELNTLLTDVARDNAADVIMVVPLDTAKDTARDKAELVTTFAEKVRATLTARLRLLATLLVKALILLIDVLNARPDDVALTALNTLLVDTETARLATIVIG
jgi:hypothetical protein